MKTTKLIASMTIAAASLLAMAAPASAHHPEIGAKVRCENGAHTIVYTVEAWETDDSARRVSNGISVELSGASEATRRGEFTKANGYKFTGSFRMLPQGNYVIKAVSALPWGEFENFGSQGEYRFVEVAVFGDCPEYAPQIPTTTRVVMVETAPPTTVTAPLIGTPQVLERAPVVQATAVEAPVVRDEVLAFTGPAMAARNALLAVGFMLIGYGLVRITRKS